MRDLSDSVNAVLEREAPALLRALSPLGRRAAFPPGAAENNGRRDLPRMPGTLAEALGGLSPEDREQAAAPSPVAGLSEVRRRWREWQRRTVDSVVPSSLPVVTAGLSHGLSLIADLFGGEGRAVATPEPFWGNYRQAFATRTGARILTAPAYRDGRFNPGALAEALADLPDGEPAVGLLNLPSNPGGYSLTDAERQEARDFLLEVAGRRPFVVVCDDAYAGLVFEPEISAASLFWDLIGAHPNLIPVKIDGATKEFSFFGGRIGFLTFGVEPESEVAHALESKLSMLIRSSVGWPVSASQVVLLQALRRPGIEAEIETVRQLLEGRYRALRDALAQADPRRLTVLPFNSGCFALVEIPEGLTSSQARRHLLDRHGVGLISLEPRYLRIAHCSVDAAALPEMVERMERGIAELSELL